MVDLSCDRTRLRGDGNLETEPKEKELNRLLPCDSNHGEGAGIMERKLRVMETAREVDDDDVN